MRLGELGELATSAFINRDALKVFNIQSSVFLSTQKSFCELTKCLGALESFTEAMWTKSKVLLEDSEGLLDLSMPQHNSFQQDLSQLNSLAFQSGYLVDTAEKMVGHARALLLLTQRDATIRSIPQTRLAESSTNRFDLKFSPPGEFLFDSEALTQARVESDQLSGQQFQAKLFRGVDPWRGTAHGRGQKRSNPFSQRSAPAPFKRAKSHRDTRGKGYSGQANSSYRGKAPRGRGRGRGRAAKPSQR